VLYPYIEGADILVVMSADGYETHRNQLSSKGTLVYERDLVHPDLKKGQTGYGVPSTRIAESLGRTIVQNIVMLGFFAAATRIVPREAMRAAVKGSVPAGTEDLNLRAFDAGWEYFAKGYGGGREGVRDEEAAAVEGAART
jgi:2-oxoglutarate ferredoxin oxidoreductase subunit gamma